MYRWDFTEESHSRLVLLPNCAFDYILFTCSVCNKLRGNPPEVRVTSGQKLGTNIIYIVLQTSLRLF